MKAPYDIAIIGGGVNGCGIARDAAGRGLSVYLCEQGDLASATSSASTKLLHGGLRYLEYLRVPSGSRGAAGARSRLANGAAHRLAAALRAAGRRDLRPLDAAARPVSLRPYRRPAIAAGDARARSRRRCGGRAAQAELRAAAFEYSDCWIDDARLVVLNARDAADRGATIETRIRALSAERGKDHWRLTTEGLRSGTATPGGGAHSRQRRGALGGRRAWPRSNGARRRRASGSCKGSHIVVPRLYDARPLLHPAESGPPDRLRHPLRRTISR